MIWLVRRYPLSTIWTVYVLYVYLLFRYFEVMR